MQQPEVALHRPLCNLLLKLEFVNTKTLHPNCKTLKWRYIGPCATLSYRLICKHQDATSDLQQPEVALHRPLCNLIVKLEFVNTRTLHPTCNNLKWRYIKTCATLIILKLELVNTKTLHPTYNNLK